MNKSDKEDCYFVHDILGNDDEIDMFFAYITSPHNIHCFQPGTQLARKKTEENQVPEVRLIPGLKLCHFREYGQLT